VSSTEYGALEIGEEDPSAKYNGVEGNLQDNTEPHSRKLNACHSLSRYEAFRVQEAVVRG